MAPNEPPRSSENHKSSVASAFQRVINTIINTFNDVTVCLHGLRHPFTLAPSAQNDRLDKHCHLNTVQ